MVAAVLDQGTTTRTAQQIADTIDFAGGDLTTGAVRDLSFVNVTVMADGLDLGVGLLADVVRRPAFANEELDRQRTQAVSALRVSIRIRTTWRTWCSTGWCSALTRTDSRRRERLRRSRR